ncbi:MAG: hypothetical protein OEW18_09315 [Candidatus Aminicenantes bacterium]|nr:hypothetical protein [Candidatus Aminicenantes bacterium]
MNPARKIIGALVIVLFGLPTLFGIIWTVGLIRATVSPEFISDLPREIIAEVPHLTDEIFKAAQDRGVISDETTRAWFEAAAKTGISPRDLLAKTGMLGWMENELSTSLREVGQVLRGERRPREIRIDLGPLKNALLHPEVDGFLTATLQNLPPCDERGDESWRQFAMTSSRHRELPACRPSLATAEDVLRAERTRAVDDIPDDVQFFGDLDVRAIRYFPFGLVGTVQFFSYLLFLIPAAFLFLGALIAASTPSGFLKWSGVSIFAGGLPVLLLSQFTKQVSHWAFKYGSFSWGERWSGDFHDLVVDKLGWIGTRIIDGLMSPVVAVAGVVCVVGIVLFALSFSARSTPKKKII